MRNSREENRGVAAWWCRVHAAAVGGPTLGGLELRYAAEMVRCPSPIPARLAATLLALSGCGDDPKGQAVPITLTASGPIVCADPSQRAEAPMEPLEAGADWALQERGGDNDPTGGGVVVADLNDDGVLDIFLPQWGVSELYFGEPSGGYRRAVSEIPVLDGEAESASVADVDGDGDLDLFVGCRGPNWLLRNDGGVFTDMTAEAGVGGDGSTYTFMASWGDIDGDEDLDLFLANHYYDPIDNTQVVARNMPPGGPSRLYLNRGDGTFEEVSERLPDGARYGYNNASAFTDKDADGDLDLYVIEDFGPYYHPNVMLENDGTGHFTDSSAADLLDIEVFGMGVGINDLNGDGIPDYLVSTWDAVVLLESAAGAWYDSALARGIVLPGEEDRHTAWGVDLADMDNDADLDAMVVFGKLFMPDDVREQWEELLGLLNPDAQPDALYLQDPSGALVESSAAWGLDDPGAGRGFVLADLNDDGWLDIVKRDIFGAASGMVSRCGEEAWLRVDLRDPGSANTRGVGAVVEVIADGQTSRRYVDAGSHNLSSGAPPEVHFGLGAIGAVNLRITWPDGAVSEASAVETRQKLTVTRER